MITNEKERTITTTAISKNVKQTKKKTLISLTGRQNGMHCGKMQVISKQMNNAT